MIRTLPPVVKLSAVDKQVVAAPGAFPVGSVGHGLTGALQLSQAHLETPAFRRGHLLLLDGVDTRYASDRLLVERHWPGIRLGIAQQELEFLSMPAEGAA